MATNTSQKQIRGYRWSKDQGRKSFFVSDGHLSFEVSRSGDKAPKIFKGRVVLHCERWYWIFCSITEQGSSASQRTAASHRNHFQTVRVRRTSSWCSICLYPGKNRRCSKIIENFKIGMSRHLDSSTRHQWPKSWSSMEDPVVLLERNLHSNPLAGLLWERQFENILLKPAWEKVSKCECLFVHRKKGYSYLCMWMTSNWLERNKISDVESTEERSWFGRTNIFPWSCILGVYLRTMWKKQTYCWGIQNQIWVTNFRRSNWKKSLWIWMCVPCYHRLCDKHVDECATRCCIWEQCSQLLCTSYGDLDLEIRILSANVTESAAWIEITRPWFLLQTYCERWKCVNRRLPCCRGMVWSHYRRHATVTWAVLEQSRIPSLSLAFLVGIPVVCLSPLHSVERIHICI